MQQESSPTLFKKYAILHILWVCIAWIAAYDHFRSMVDGEAFLATEINPIVIAVYSLLGNSLLLFCLAKFVSSVVTMTALLAIRRHEWARPIYVAIAGFQLLVLLSYCPVVNPL